ALRGRDLDLPVPAALFGRQEALLMAEHIASRRMYVLIWAALIFLTVLTALMSHVDLDDLITFSGGGHPPLNAVVALLIAGTKATLVVLFFMHMRWSDGPSRMAAVAGLFWLAIMFLLTV